MPSEVNFNFRKNFFSIIIILFIFLLKNILFQENIHLSKISYIQYIKCLAEHQYVKSFEELDPAFSRFKAIVLGKTKIQ